MPEIKAECASCNATGLYQGFAEPEDTAVICRDCSGSGCRTLRYKEFTKRKKKRGIKRVANDGGTWFARDGELETISIHEFYEAMPE
jgi:hypothetical protein